ncbi:MAG: hypothetical protein KJ568_04090 [Actinobacteria bacterium]|nr:hypothetical protein [Actinomycetota bacterium]
MYIDFGLYKKSEYSRTTCLRHGEFQPNPVGFQIGYDSDWSNDKLWWSKLPQPYPKYVGEAIFLKIPKDQECSIFWVDFTLREVLLDK